ncbi:MAG: ATP-binding protein [Negativicutes bacterium]|jgi:hypothetical protein
MLIQFTVSNFLSFKDEQTFSMVADTNKKDTELTDNIFGSVDERISLLRSAVMYGANASGKSNFIKALAFFFSFILASTNSTEQQTIAVRPYRLEPHYDNKPTKVEAVFEVGNFIYRYGYEVTQRAVLKEWLYVIEANKQRKHEKLIFERSLSELTAKVTGWKKLMPLTRENSLLLTVAAQFNLLTAKQIINRLAASVMVVSGVDELFAHTTDYLFSQQEKGQNADIIADVCKFLKSADISIDGFKVINRELKKADFADTIPTVFANFLDSLAGDSVSFKQVITMHKQFDSDGNVAGVANFDMAAEESGGTNKLFALSVPLLMTLQRGGLLIIDELESNLHPVIVRYLLSLFNSRIYNKNNAQIVFTTHNDSILSNSIFRRDQIWFSEKGEKGATEIFSLVEFRENKAIVRKDASYNKDYLSGRYGAIPIVTDNYVSEIHSRTEKYD